MTAKFAPAAPADYARWLKLHLNQGGRITHFYDYPMARAGFLVALRPFVLGGECGADARHILMPEGASWNAGGGMGHNTVYLADGTVKGTWVPVYADEAFHGLPGYEEGMVADRKASAEFWARSREFANRGPYSDLTRYAKGAPDFDRPTYTAPSTGASVFVEDGQVCLLPSHMLPDEALALSENIRAAALGASR
jgi:hypothetical protein